MFLLHVVLVMTVGSLVAVSSQQNGDVDLPSCTIETTRLGTFVICKFPLDVAVKRRDFNLQIVSTDKSNLELALACYWKSKKTNPECGGIPGFQLMNDISNTITIKIPSDYDKFEFKCGLIRMSSDALNTISEGCSNTPDNGVVQINGNWGDWHEEGSCSVMCGDGVQMMTRSCDNPAPTKCGEQCAGSDHKLQHCNLRTCNEFTALTTGMITGMTALGIVVIALAITTVCFWRCYCKRSRNQSNLNNVTDIDPFLPSPVPGVQCKVVSTWELNGSQVLHKGFRAHVKNGSVGKASKN